MPWTEVDKAAHKACDEVLGGIVQKDMPWADTLRSTFRIGFRAGAVFGMTEATNKMREKLDAAEKREQAKASAQAEPNSDSD
jgi:hypothetical protein